LQGFRSRLGRPFAAILKLTDEHKLEFDFGQSRDDDDANAEPIDFSAQPALGPCPKCGGNVYEHGLSYVCEKSLGPNRSCDFRSGKIILQQEIAAEQMRKLLAEGKTDLLLGFVSSRTRRKFKAFLVRGADGKIGFEFTPRPEKSKAGAGAKAPRPAMTRPRTPLPNPRRASGPWRQAAAPAAAAGAAAIKGKAGRPKQEQQRRARPRRQPPRPASRPRQPPRPRLPRLRRPLLASRRPSPCAARRPDRTGSADGPDRSRPRCHSPAASNTARDHRRQACG
jgi:DNA topoisomerase-3